MQKSFVLLLAGVAMVLTSARAATDSTADALINKLVQKGLLTEKEAQDVLSETTQTNLASASKWKISNAIKNIELFGDLRFRYEYRAADNVPGTGSTKDDFVRERFRYSLRIGLRGDLFDNFFYGIRLDTAANPRSPWVTFGEGGSQANPTSFAKDKFGINVGQAYLGWRPADWYEMTIGKMPMPLYVTPMVWDSDLNPEGAVEKFKLRLGRKVDLFANFGQFIYQAQDPDLEIPAGDTFMLAWQVGAMVKVATNMSFKIAPVLYNYTGHGSAFGLNKAYSGQGLDGINLNTPGFNQNGINDLLVLEVPAEFNFRLGKYNARVFGDFGYNFDGDDRATAAFAATAPAGRPPHPFTGENKAYQVGAGIGNLGLVYGQTSKKHTWEARAYWQHIEQYALDVNLIDSDFFERANEQGVYTAFAYSLTDAIIGTIRYGYANPINKELGTGGNNPDLPILNPIKNYHLLQVDVTWRF